jgi:L-iditol 2-dehydrogenase
MKAAMLEGVNQLVVKEVPTPGCPEGGVLMKVRACGLCGSDIRKIRAGNSHFNYPVLLGHEVTGEVVKSNSGRFNVGDRLAIGSIIPCGVCNNCKKGIDNLCQNAIYHSLGLYKDGYHGGYAEYIALNRNMVDNGPVVQIPDVLSYSEAALVEPFTDVLNSHGLITVHKGEIAVVVGAGPIGAMHVDLLQSKGVDCILADISADRLALADKVASPRYIVNSSKENLKDAIMRITQGYGADIVIIACSVPFLQATSPELACYGGRIILFGGLNDKDKMLTMDSGLIHYKQLSVYGTMGSCKRHFTEVMALLAQKKINADAYITEMPLGRIGEAIRLAEKGEILKVVLIP